MNLNTADIELMLKLIDHAFATGAVRSMQGFEELKKLREKLEALLAEA